MQSINNKRDELRLRSAEHSLGYCALALTETWLDQNIPDAAIQLAGRPVTRVDSKSKGSGLCIFTSDLLCTNVVVRDAHCSPDIEYLLLQRRPFYLPREFTSVGIIAVYVPPHANTKLAMEKLHLAISRYLSTQPDSVVIAAGNFNNANLKSVLPKLCKLPNKEKKMLDQVYCNISHAFKASPLPHLGFSDQKGLSVQSNQIN